MWVGTFDDGIDVQVLKRPLARALEQNEPSSCHYSIKNFFLPFFSFPFHFPSLHLYIEKQTAYALGLFFRLYAKKRFKFKTASSARCRSSP